ncbi:MAG: tetratricopeptide (TPR) repeat protein [Flavobacteriaceae bacterium]|jgi:tetratricopeptide (TPR) repeat protein
MKFTLLIGLFLAFSSNAFSNVLPTDSTTSVIDKANAVLLIEEGRTLFAQGKMKDALIKFRLASIKDPNSWKAPYWISQCHYTLNNYGYALKYAQVATRQGAEKINDEVYFILGTCHHRLGHLDSALTNYEMAMSTLPKRRSKELLIPLLMEEISFAEEAISKNSSDYSRMRLQGRVNSGYDDYNVVLADGGKKMYFTSRRSNTTGGGMNPDDQRFFEDTYLSIFDSELREWDDVSNEIGKINSDGFDALNYLSEDGLYGIMTMNTTALDIKMKKATKGSDICELKMNNQGTWNTPKIIKNKTINTSYFEGSATLTADGNTMYFVSDRKGDESSTDIYKVEKVGKAWGDAEVLPMTINSAGRETTPFITPDGRFLFYSSDGLTGMGGLDVYVVENKGGEWGSPVNLGAGINTVNNDSHFVYAIESKTAYVSGYEIVGNKSSLDIYQLDMTNFSIPTE